MRGLDLMHLRCCHSPDVRSATTYCSATRLLVLMVVLCPWLFGQATEGTILGTLTDATGAVVSNAVVNVESLGTGVVRTTRSNNLGEYLVSNLPLGTYSVSTDAPGFKRAVQPQVTITVKARVRVDFQLEIGDTTQIVEVTAIPALIKTDTAETGGVVNRELLQDMPVFSRNFMSLAALVPGTTGGGGSSRQRDFSGSAITIGGASAEANNFIVDGISNNMEFSGAMGVTPAIDAIQEFAVQTSQYSAEFGRSGGGVVNVAIRSGTNEYHGFAYDYLRNDKLDARPYDFTGTTPVKQPLRRNQFGAGLGMPIIKNRVFLFGNYEGIRFPSSSNSFQIVPTVLEKQGNFSASGFVVADPATATSEGGSAGLGTRTPFPNNVIPSTRFDRIGVDLLSYFPDPNYTDPNPNVRNNLFVAQTNNQSLDTFNIKSDANLTDKDMITGRLSQQRGGRNGSSWMPNDRLGGKAALDSSNAGLTYTRLVSPTVVNEARLGYNYLRFGNEMLNNEPVLGKFNIPGYNVLPFADGMPGLSIRNYTGPATLRPIASVPNPFFLVEHSWQLMDNLSFQLGSHALKVGGEYGTVNANRFQGRNGGGNLSFDGTYTTPIVGQALESLRNGVPDTLLGLARSFSTQYAFDAVRIRSKRASGFIQDDWRLLSNLTLNLGLRWEFFGPYREEQDRFANFDLSTGTRVVPESTRSIVQNVLGVPNGDLPSGWRYGSIDEVIPRKNWKNFSPRFGFAYNPTSKLVFRGGMGMFYGVTVSNNFNNAGTEGNPFFFDLSLASELNRPIIVRDGFPTGGVLGPISAPTFGAYYGPLDRDDPYTIKWNFNIQYSLTNLTAFEIGYSGQNARKFATLVPGNVPEPGPGAVQDRRPYPHVGGFWQFVPVNDSNYNGLEFTFKQREIKGFSAQTAYTFSKALGYNQGTDQTLNDAYNLKYDWGPLTYDFRHRWVTAFSYKIPTYSGWGKALTTALGNWDISSLVTFQGGAPFTVGVSGPTLNNGAGSNRANILRDARLSSGERSMERWFDTTAFSTPPNYVWGSQGKGMLRAPGMFQWDFAVQKRFPITESMRFALRMEAQNFFNTVNLGAPAATLNSPNFGVIRGLSTGPRNIQLAARFEF
jgi:hypothetical protein